MKRIIIVCSVMMPVVANAAAPSTSCPAGYVEVAESLTISGGACPSGTTSIGTADSCLVASPAGSCMMYAPTGMTFTDDTGSYEFTEICPLG